MVVSCRCDICVERVILCCLLHFSLPPSLCYVYVGHSHNAADRGHARFRAGMGVTDLFTPPQLMNAVNTVEGMQATYLYGGEGVQPNSSFKVNTACSIITRVVHAYGITLVPRFPWHSFVVATKDPASLTVSRLVGRHFLINTSDIYR